MPPREAVQTTSPPIPGSHGKRISCSASLDADAVPNLRSVLLTDFTTRRQVGAALMVLRMRDRAMIAVAIIGLIATGDAIAGVVRMRRLVVVGDSLLAGFGSGGFVAAGRPGPGQVDGAAVFLARRAHVRLPLPLMTRPGVPPELTIVDENRNGKLDRGEVRRQQSGLGFRADPGRKVRNLCVP